MSVPKLSLIAKMVAVDDLFTALLEAKSAVLADVELPAGRAQEAPAQDAPAERAPAQAITAQDAPAQAIRAQDAPAERLLVRSNLTGTMQLYELDGGSELQQLTDLPDPVATAHYVPGTRQAVIAVDSGGDERHQLYLLDIESAVGRPAGREDLWALTDEPKYGHHFAGVSPDGRQLAYLSNKANGVDFDLWVYDLVASRHSCVFATGGWGQPASGFSPDGRFVSVIRPGPRPLDTDLLLVELATGEVTNPMPHPDEAALVGPPAWVGTATFYASSSVGRDFAAVVRYEVGTGRTSVVAGTGEAYDSQVLSSRGGITLAIITNRDGASQVRLFDAQELELRAGPEVPLVEPGVVTSYATPDPVFSADGQRLFYTLTTPRVPGDIWAYDRLTAETRRVTSSPTQVAPERLVTPEPAVVESFDGERVPIFVFRPREHAPDARVPDPRVPDPRVLDPRVPDPRVPDPRVPDPRVVVKVHGGPESQAVLQFDPVVQGLVGAGYAVVVPNVRGSTGYGKRYASLDDTTRRLDSVRDLAAIHAWIAREGLGAGRAALWGGSYGGYMVLAGLAFQPELWAAGVDIVGVSDLVTFLENTSDYRRAHREREYGSLEHDREFLASVSPLRHVDNMRAPLFVIHGRNDPRVPISETEQLVAKLRQRDIRCDLVVYEDEGHGLARLKNMVDAYPRALAFLDEVFGP
jgi:dipeptidyl aminopeptidase/acylaminoacyl peptidase